MFLRSDSFPDGGRIPAANAFAEPDPQQHARLAPNRSPHLCWGDLPAGTRSLVLLCTDVDVPSRGDDVNQEGRTVPLDLPRVEFQHWVLVDLPATAGELAEGACSDGVTAGGKQRPAGPAGSRQGVNDYTGWFAGHPEMGGTYRGYDGPGPPWNDERLHHYHFRLLATDLARCPVDGDFRASDVLEAIEGHVLDEARWVGTYTQYPGLL